MLGESSEFGVWSRGQPAVWAASLVVAFTVAHQISADSSREGHNDGKGEISARKNEHKYGDTLSKTYDNLYNKSQCHLQSDSVARHFVNKGLISVKM